MSTNLRRSQAIVAAAVLLTLAGCRTSELEFQQARARAICGDPERSPGCYEKTLQEIMERDRNPAWACAKSELCREKPPIPCDRTLSGFVCR